MFEKILPEIVLFEMWKNIVDPDRPQRIMQHGARELHAGYLRLQTRTQNM